MACADGTDPAAQTALAVGTKIIYEDDAYLALEFDDPTAIPTQLDPDG